MKKLLKVCGYVVVIWMLVIYLAIYTFGSSGMGGGKFKAECKTDQKTVCHIQLGPSIGLASDYYELRAFLKEQLKSDQDVAVFHLAGFGGYIDGATYLINVIKELPAQITMKVDGDVYSAHALLALTGHNIQLPDEGLMYFHASSGTNMAAVNCLSQIFSLDRGNWGYTACIDESRQINEIQNNIMIKYLATVLTTKELMKVISGGTVVLPVDVVKARLRG